MKLTSLLSSSLIWVTCIGRIVQLGPDTDAPPDTRKLLEIKEERIPELHLSYITSFHLERELDQKHYNNYAFAHLRKSLNGTELVKFLGLEDPTVEEALNAFGELTMAKIQSGIPVDKDTTRLKDLDSYSLDHHSWNSHDAIIENGTFYYPTDRHAYTLRKYASAVIPFYIILGLFSLIVYLFKNKIFHHRERLIKFSNVSTLIAKVLIVKLCFDVCYLLYLAIFSTFHVLSRKLYFIFFLVVDQIIDIGVFHGTIAVFVQGYLTLHYDKKVLYNKQAILLTFIYLISVFAIKVYVKVVSFDSFWDPIDHYEFNFKDRNLSLGVFMCVYTIVCRIIMILIILREFWRNYKESNQNDKYLLSFVIIIGSYLLSAYVKVPVYYDVGEFWRGHLKEIFIGDGDLSLQTDSTTIPEIFLILTGSVLIYIWRDISYEKLQQDEDIELQ